ncbi:TPA: hypothetical protein DDZ10_02640 [Candidatus Uhrbacteria bacterium]|nr:hypothetical protein [Candidatus Uhrbacteria bacterium]
MSMQSQDKFKNLVLYVLSHGDYKEGGIKKLNKLLYFIDFYFYRDHERLISGVSYAKADMGPIVDDYRVVFDELEQKGFLEPIEDTGFKAYKPLVKADLAQFNPEEIDHIGRVLDRYGKLSSAELEGISHQQQPWVLTEHMGDIIDPDLALLIADDDSDESYLIENDAIKNELVSLANSV